jgi:hypothetical protein
LLCFTLGFVVVEVVDVEVVVVEVEVVEVVVEVAEDVVDELDGIEDSILIEVLVAKTSTGDEAFLELDVSGGPLLISGSVGSATKVVTSSLCSVSEIIVMGAAVSLALTRKNHYSLEDE